MCVDGFGHIIFDVDLIFSFEDFNGTLNEGERLSLIMTISRAFTFFSLIKTWFSFVPNL